MLLQMWVREGETVTGHQTSSHHWSRPPLLRRSLRWRDEGLEVLVQRGRSPGCVDLHIHTQTHTHMHVHGHTDPIPPHLDKSQDLNLIKSSHTCPSSGSTYNVKTANGSHRLGIKIKFLATVCPALETSLCPPQSPQWSHTGPYSVLLSFPLHRTLQVLCPRLESSFLPTPPLPR